LTFAPVRKTKVRRVEELEQLNKSLRNSDKLKNDAISHLSDQLVELSTRLQDIERRHRQLTLSVPLNG
jgi:hypothetical protein